MDFLDSSTPPPSFYIFKNTNNQSKFGGIITLIFYIIQILCVIFLIYDYIEQTPIISFVELWEPNEEKKQNIKIAFRYSGRIDFYDIIDLKAKEKIVKNDSTTKEEHEIETFSCDQNFKENINGEWKCIKGGFNFTRKINDYNYLYFPLILQENNKTEIGDKTIKIELIYERKVIHHFNFLNPFTSFLDKKDYTFQKNIRTIYYEYLKNIKYETKGSGFGISFFDYCDFKYFNLTKLGSKSKTQYSTYIDRNEGTIRILSNDKNESGGLALHFSNNSIFYERKYSSVFDYISIFGGYYSVFILISEVILSFYSKTNENFRIINYIINKNQIHKMKFNNNLSLVPLESKEEENKEIISEENKNNEDRKKELLFFETEDSDEDYERKLKRTITIDSLKNINFISIFGNGIDFFGCMKHRKNQQVLNYINEFIQDNFSLEKIYFNQLKLEELIQKSQIKDESAIINEIEKKLNSFT